MAKNYYLPRSDERKSKWLNNFATKLPNYAAKYSVMPEEVADMQNSSPVFEWLLQYKNQLTAYVSGYIDYKNIARDGTTHNTPLEIPIMPTFMPPGSIIPGIFARATAIANRIKSHINYSTADGEDLGIEGTESSVDFNALKPKLQARLVSGGHPEIVWKKQGMDGIEIQKMDENGQWQFLAVDLKPNYTDNALLPSAGSSAVWQYRAIYLYKDERVGQWSDVLVVTVAG